MNASRCGGFKFLHQIDHRFEPLGLAADLVGAQCLPVSEPGRKDREEPTTDEPGNRVSHPNAIKCKEADKSDYKG